MLQNNEILCQIGRPKLPRRGGGGEVGVGPKKMGAVKSVRKTVCQIIFHSICPTRSSESKGKRNGRRKAQKKHFEGGRKKMLMRQVKGHSRGR